MNNTWKRLAALVLTAVMVLGLAVSAGATDENEAAAAAITDTTLTITGVAKDDTVNAYRLIGYPGENVYNDYEFEPNFDAYVSGKNTSGKSNEAFLETSDANALKDLLASYAMSGNLPAAATYTATAGEGGTATFQLAPGYYLFVGQTTAANSKLYQVMSAFVQVKQGNIVVYGGGSQLTTTDGVYTLAAKSENGPTIDKKVYDSRVKDSEDLGSVWKTAAAAAVGDTVEFYVKVELPAYGKGVHKLNLTVEDTMTGLSYVENPVELYKDEIGGILSNKITTEGAVTATPKENGVAFALNYDKLTPDHAETHVYIRYQAKVTDEAINANNCATNSAVLKYQADNDTEHETDEVSTKVYNYAYYVTKVDNENQPLPGAKFTLYKTYAGGTWGEPIGLVKETDAPNVYYRLAQDGEATVTEIEAPFTVKGLNLGEFYMKETTVPSGFYTPKSGVKVVLSGNRDANSELNGSLTGCNVELLDNRDVAMAAGAINATSENQYDVTIRNNPTPILPTTGGPGTVLFTLVGVALMVLGAWLFIFRRKKHA